MVMLKGKARMVAQDFSQQRGDDYNETSHGVALNCCWFGC